MTARFRRRIALATLCCLLAIATSASAECAWVLWLGTGETYTTVRAFGGNEGEKVCQEESAKLMAEMKKNPVALQGFLKSGSHYMCLPDTVDPRGPKGK